MGGGQGSAGHHRQSMRQRGAQEVRLPRSGSPGAQREGDQEGRERRGAARHGCAGAAAARWAARWGQQAARFAWSVPSRHAGEDAAQSVACSGSCKEDARTGPAAGERGGRQLAGPARQPELRTQPLPKPPGLHRASPPAANTPQRGWKGRPAASALQALFPHLPPFGSRGEAIAGRGGGLCPRRGEQHCCSQPPPGLQGPRRPIAGDSRACHASQSRNCASGRRGAHLEWGAARRALCGASGELAGSAGIDVFTFYAVRAARPVLGRRTRLADLADLAPLPSRVLHATHPCPGGVACTVLVLAG